MQFCTGIHVLQTIMTTDFSDALYFLATLWHFCFLVNESFLTVVWTDIIFDTDIYGAHWMNPN